MRCSLWCALPLVLALLLAACADDLDSPGDSPAGPESAPETPSDTTPSDPIPGLEEAEETEEGVSLPLEDEEYEYDPPPRAERDIPLPPPPEPPEEEEVELPEHEPAEEIPCCDSAFAFPHHSSITEVWVTGSAYPLHGEGHPLTLEDDRWVGTVCMPITYEGGYRYVVTSEIDRGLDEPELFVVELVNEAAPTEQTIGGTVNWFTTAAVETCDDLVPDEHSRVIPFDE